MSRDDPRVWVSSRKDKSKRAYIVRWYDSSGRMRGRTIGTDKREAKRVASRMEAEMHSGRYCDITPLPWDTFVEDHVNKIVGKLAEANGLEKIIDLADVNDEEKLGKGKEMQDRLSKLVAIFDGLDFRANRPEGDDLLGDAYEYLMRHFATESGKSKGQFYTPAEVSRIMAKVVGIGPGTRQDQTIYDPT